MSDRLDRMEKDVGNAQILDKIQGDAIEAGLFQQYVESLPPQNQADSKIVLQKRLDPGREGLTHRENIVLQTLTRVYIERKRKVDLLIANLNDTDIKQLGTILAQHTTFVDQRELPLYILGLGVRAGPDFDSLVKRVQDWKQSARDKVAERKTVKYEARLNNLAARWGISQEELDRLTQLPDNGLRLQELKAALGRSRGMQRVWDLARATTAHTRDRELNKLIKNIRSESGILRENLGGVLAALASFGTNQDRWWKDIPDAVEMFERQKDANTPKDEKPVTLPEAREMSSDKAVTKEFYANVDKIPDGRAKFERAKRTGDPWNTLVDTGSGVMRPWGEVFGDVTKNIESTIKSRGLLSKLWEILFSPMMKSNFNKAKAQIQAV